MVEVEDGDTRSSADGGDFPIHKRFSSWRPRAEEEDDGGKMKSRKFESLSWITIVMQMRRVIERAEKIDIYSAQDAIMWSPGGGRSFIKIRHFRRFVFFFFSFHPSFMNFHFVIIYRPRKKRERSSCPE